VTIQFITTEEAAQILGVTVKWLANGRSRGYGPPHVRLGRCTVRYNVSALEAWDANERRKEEAAANEAESTAVRNFTKGTTPEQLLPACTKGPVVYFAVIGRAIKIGYTTDLERRMEYLQKGTPERVRLVAVLPGGRELEKKLHQRFNGAWISGEFFGAEAVMEFLVNIGNEIT
jgi:hypothetical protein